jgi:hypothetical protein
MAPNECIKISHNCNALSRNDCSPTQIWNARSRTKSSRVLAIRGAQHRSHQQLAGQHFFEQRSCEEFHHCRWADQDRLPPQQARTMRQAFPRRGDVARCLAAVCDQTCIGSQCKKQFYTWRLHVPGSIVQRSPPPLSCRSISAPNSTSTRIAESLPLGEAQ